MTTRSVDLYMGQSRVTGENRGTVFLPGPRGADRRLRPPVAFRDVFVAHYDGFAREVRAGDEAGVAVVAVDLEARRVAGIMRLHARPGRVVSGTVGRHTQADLYLPGCPTLSLRELAVLVEPARSFQKGSVDVGYRVVDLGTGRGFADEEGRVFRGVRCEGSAFFSTETFALLFLAVGDPADYPERATDAWDMVPERIFFDERRPGGSGLAAGSQLVRLPRSPGEGRTTAVRMTAAPSPLDELAAGSVVGPVAGTLELEPGGRWIPVTPDALRDGILLGRYPRCASSDAITDDSVSRTHLLVIEAAGGPWAVDTGSSFGTWLGAARVQAQPLVDGARLRLGEATHVTWRGPGAR